MAAFNFSDAVDDVLPHLAADPSAPVTEAAIRNAAIEFCATSGVWCYTQPDGSLLAGERAVELEPDMGAEVARVEAVRYRGKALQPIRLATWATKPQADGPSFWTQNDNVQILVQPTPVKSEAGAIEIDMVLQPSRSATSIPGWIWTKWGEDIVSGALARLMLMPSRPWTAVDIAVAHQNKFHNAMYAARVGTVTNRGKSPLRTRSCH